MGGLVGGFTWVLSVRWVDMWAIWWVFELAGCLVGELTCVQSGGWVGELVSFLVGDLSLGWFLLKDDLQAVWLVG